MNANRVIVARRGLFSLPVMLGGFFVVLLIAGFLMYELGLTRAGFRSADAAREIGELEAANRDLSESNKTLSERVAVLETAAKIDREAYRKVDEELAELQSKILAQQEDIEFYRGIVGEDDGSQLRVQELRIEPGLMEREFSLRLVLAQALRGTRAISGNVELAVEGLQRSEPARLGLKDLGYEGGSLRYEFRYFEDLRADITLPAEFEPQRVQVRLKPHGTGAKTVEEFYVWAPETG